MSEQDRLELKLKADLHQDILKLIKKKRLTPRQLEKLFDIPQPRVSELLRGKLSLLSVSRLLYYAYLLGAHADVRLKASRLDRDTTSQQFQPAAAPLSFLP